MASSLGGSGSPFLPEEPRKALVQGPGRTRGPLSTAGDGPRLGSATRNLDLVLDIPVQVTVELGQTRLRIEELIALRPGAILDLDRRAGEPVDLRVQGHLIAQAEVVLVDGGLGVQITSLAEGPQRLGGLALATEA
ncbi:MAG: flagellar motor switch protein FliN [Planctomycetes bacterium]|nr:flagellar motor switch protein FliN [Planctomycetota bacterium]